MKKLEERELSFMDKKLQVALDKIDQVVIPWQDSTSSRDCEFQYEKLIDLIVNVEKIGIKVNWIITPSYIEVLFILNSELLPDKLEACVVRERVQSKNDGNTDIQAHELLSTVMIQETSLWMNIKYSQILRIKAQEADKGMVKATTCENKSTKQ
tara:strand:+ start:4191 stop:4652 length:462 start_codon:yes stop_codon:yes gene_type:complete